MILHNLSFAEILLAQRINKDVVETISIHKGLRHKLFLLPESIDHTVQLMPRMPSLVIRRHNGPERPYMILDFLQRLMQTYCEGTTFRSTAWATRTSTLAGGTCSQPNQRQSL